VGHVLLTHGRRRGVVRGRWPSANKFGGVTVGIRDRQNEGLILAGYRNVVVIRSGITVSGKMFMRDVVSIKVVGILGVNDGDICRTGVLDRRLIKYILEKDGG
jgi:hypothetical protein